MQMWSATQRLVCKLRVEPVGEMGSPLNIGRKALNKHNYNASLNANVPEIMFMTFLATVTLSLHKKLKGSHVCFRRLKINTEKLLLGLLSTYVLLYFFNK